MRTFDWITFKEVDAQIPYNGGPYGIIVAENNEDSKFVYIPNCTNANNRIFNHFTHSSVRAKTRSLGILFDKEIMPITTELQRREGDGS